MPQRLGQHFLIRHSVVNRILQALELSPQDSVLEIGPGKGALTGPLIEKVKKFLLIEKDPVLAEDLSQRLQNRENVQVLCQDFLETPWNQITSHLGEHFKIVSNLPYEAATAILTKLVSSAKPGTVMVLMFQKEVADRILAQPHTKAMGSLTVFIQLFAKVHRLLDVPPSAFLPPPKVFSTVLKFWLREKPLLDLEHIPSFENMLACAFAHRRKMLRQNLKAVFQNDTVPQIENRLVGVGASAQARAEELSMEQWLALFHQWMAEKT